MPENDTTPRAVVPATPRAVAPVAVEDGRGIVLRSMDDLARFAVAAVKSGLAPVAAPEAVMVLVQTGMEAGLSPMAALRSLYITPGASRPGWYTESAVAVVRSKGNVRLLEFGCEHGPDGAPLFGWARGERKDGIGGLVERRFSVDDAKRAGLWGRTSRNGSPSPWVLYPARMLQARALGFLVHDLWSDALMGLPLREELDDVALVSGRAPELAHGTAPPRTPDPLFLPTTETPPAASDERKAEEATPREAYNGGPTVCPICGQEASDFEGEHDAQSAHACENGHRWNPRDVARVERPTTGGASSSAHEEA